MALEEIRKARLEKLEKLKKAGVDPYPAKSWRSHKIDQVLDNFDDLSDSKSRIVLVGRIMAKREHGGSVFLDLIDESEKVQVYFKKDVLGEREFDFFMETVDIGDFLEVYGFLFKTKKEEKTLEVEKYRLLAKTIMPLPEKWHGLQDVEERYRKRYLDLIFNSEVKDKFKTRTAVIKGLRSFLDSNDFMEVETPILQLIPGGALAKPFKSHMNALDLEVYLRVAPELFLKRLLVGGFERVYEFAKNFRNEGMDHDHNPEFTMLEFYVAYKDYNWVMEFIEQMLENLAAKIFGNTKILHEGREIDLHGPYKRLTFNEVLKESSGLDYDDVDEEILSKKAKDLGITIDKTMTKGNIADEIYKKLARPNIIQPTFVTNHPLEISPLAKKLENSPDYVARVQLIVGGQELTNCFSELNDPIDQKERFEVQQKLIKKGHQEAHPYDEEFIEALEYGMPPAVGFGMGIDRLTVLFTNSHALREVILFPLMRPK
ncbi:MAG: lysine--tRNA ligase [Parcubacteria group bacterium]|nr:lysine--tRNA ligase [Parcubacteria group bacterium]